MPPGLKKWGGHGPRVPHQIAPMGIFIMTYGYAYTKLYHFQPQKLGLGFRVSVTLGLQLGLGLGFIFYVYNYSTSFLTSLLLQSPSSWRQKKIHCLSVSKKAKQLFSANTTKNGQKHAIL